MLEKQVISVPLTGALDTESSPFVVPPGSLVAAENVYRDRTGRWTPRPGRAQVTTAAPVPAIDSGARLFTINDQLGLVGRRNLRLWNPTAQRWSATTPVEPTIHKVDTLQGADITTSGGALDFYNVDAAVGGGLRFVAWESNDVPVSGYGASVNKGVYTCMMDDATGAFLFPPAGPAFGVGNTHPRVVYSTARARFALCYVTAAGQIHASSWDKTGNIVSPTAIVTDLAAGVDCWFDVQARGDTGMVVVAYRSNAGTLKALEFDPGAAFVITVTIAATVVVAADVADRALGWMDQRAWAGPLYLATSASTATGTVVRTLSGTTLAQAAAGTVEAVGRDVRNITGHYDGTTLAVFYEVAGATSLDNMVRYGTSAGVTGIFLRGCGLAAKACLFQHVPGTNPYEAYVTVVTQGELASSYFVAKVLAGAVPVRNTIVARVLYEVGGGVTPARNCISGSAVSDTSSMTFGVRKKNDVVGNAGAPYFVYQAAACRIWFYASRAVQAPAEVARLEYLPFSLPRFYDGFAASEPDIMVSPEKPVSLTPTAGAGALTSAVTYQYLLVNVRTDSTGRLWRSVQGGVKSVAMGASDNVVTMVWSNGGRMGDGIFRSQAVEAYRTAGGTSFFRHPKIQQVPTTDTFTLVDLQPDTALQAETPLYTDSGELPNYQPPPTLAAVLAGGRLLFLDAEDRRQVWASKAILAGNGIYTHPGLLVRIEDGGDHTAIAALDGQPIVFKIGSIYKLTGEWPDNAGASTVLPRADRISDAIGALSQESVVQTPLGLMFKDRKGIFLLTRGLQAQYIGSGVEAFNSWTVVGAALMQGEQQVRFLATNGVQGRDLVYDYGHETWSVFTLPDCATGVSYVHCAVANGGIYYVLRSDGIVLQDDATTYRDAGATYTCKLTTGCLLPAGAEHNARIYEISANGQLLNTGTSPVLKFYYEGDLATLVDTKTFNLAAGEFTGSGGRFTIKARPSRQKGQALQASLEWVPTAASGGISVDGFALEIGSKKGLRPTAAAGTK